MNFIISNKNPNTCLPRISKMAKFVLILILAITLANSATYQKLTCYTNNQIQPGGAIQMDCFTENVTSPVVSPSTTQSPWQPCPGYWSTSPTPSTQVPPSPSTTQAPVTQFPTSSVEYNCRQGLDLLITKSPNQRIELDCGDLSERGRILSYLESAGIVGCYLALNNIIYCNCQNIGNCQPSRSPQGVTLVQSNHRINL